MCEEAIIIREFLFQPSKNGFDSFGFRDRDAADIQQVDEVADAYQSRVTIQRKACEKHFECHTVINMGESGPIEVKPNHVGL